MNYQMTKFTIEEEVQYLRAKCQIEGGLTTADVGRLLDLSSRVWAAATVEAGIKGQ